MTVDNNATIAYIVGIAGAFSMATLNLRNIPDSVHRQLRIRAAKHGQSMEREARQILQHDMPSPSRKQGARELQEWVDALYQGKPPHQVVDGLIAERRREAAAE